MLPILQIGPFAMQTPGLVLLVGVWAGLWLAERYSTHFKISGNQIYNLALLSIGAGLVGARIFYIARFPEAFLLSPTSAFSINPGLLDPTAGLLAGLIVGVFYGQRIGLYLLDTLDALTPFLGIMTLAINLANLASGNAYGRTTDLPWAIDLWGAQRHPSQIYHLIAGGIILLIILRMIPRINVRGLLFFTFIGLTAASVLFLEIFRADSQLIFSGIRSAQLMAWILLGGSLIIIWRLIQKEHINAES